MAAFLQQGTTAIRDAVADVFTHVGVTDDDTAFNATQTALNPSGGDVFIAAATKTDVDFATKDYAIQVTSADFGGRFINAIGIMTGNTASDAASRAVRELGIGVESANDTFNLAVRLEHQDITP